MTPVAFVQNEDLALKPAHDDGSMCEVTQTNYHVRGNGFCRLWDVYLRPRDSPR